MTFVLTVSPDDDLDVQFLEDHTSDIAIAPIGYDDDEGATYSVLAGLVLRPGAPGGHKELLFYVIEADEDGEATINSGLGTRRFLVGEDRSIVLHCICRVVRRLIETSEANVISMTTVETHLPKKALLKYSAVCEAIAAAGYAGGQSDSYRGVRVWMFERRRTEL